jgi:hypothetical protein
MGFAGQDEKRRLKCILRVVMVAEHAPADAPDHWAMPPHESRECGFILVLQEAFKEMGVGLSCAVVDQDGSAEMVDDGAGRGDRHVASLRVAEPCSITYSSVERVFIRFFRAQSDGRQTQ